MVLSIIFRSTAMPESIIRKVLWQSLLALHHLHTAIDDRPGVVHRALSPEKRE
jgi:serine/threonine protein kinase